MGTKDDLATHNEERKTIIRNREVFNDRYHSTGAPGTPRYSDTSDNYYSAQSDSDRNKKSKQNAKLRKHCGVQSDSDMNELHKKNSKHRKRFYSVQSDSDINELYKNDAKLRKRCVVEITRSKELIESMRKRNEWFNEILEKQRREMELRAKEKQREKEEKRLQKEREQTILDNSEAAKTAASGKEILPSRMNCKSEYKTKFQVPIQQNSKELKPLNIRIEMTETVTTTLLDQIDDHLDKPPSNKSQRFEVKEQQQEKQTYTDINQQTCDIDTDRDQTKLNLLADIAQHLSPYQIDLPENNPPRTPSPAPEPPPLSASQIPKNKEVPKETATVTEQLIIQSLDNLLDKSKPQLDNNDQLQEASTIYAHEPKLNTSAIFKSSSCANVVQNHNQHFNTQLENNDKQVQNNSAEKEINSKTQADETLEQILEESISVLKFATSPCNPLRQEINSDSTIPLLISNVESLNQCKQNIGHARQKSDDTVNLLPKNITKPNSESLALATIEVHNKEINGKPKNVIEEHNFKNEAAAVLSSNILNNVECSIICATVLSNIHNETEISRSSLMASDLSNIFSESEMSKHLPETAEPSPIVTDNSDYSNESDASKSFGGVHIPITTNTTAETAAHSNSEISVTNSLEGSSKQFHCSLNTPIKLRVEMSRENLVGNNSTNDLNTPIKFAMQSDFGDNNTPPKTTIEPETDNVTKFLDLILNKTVTDAESETHDRILKELDAVTSATHENSCNNEMTQESKLKEKEPEALTSATHENDCNKEIVTQEAKMKEKGKIKSTDTVENKTDLKQQINLATENNKSPHTFEHSTISHIENNSSATQVPNDLETTSANNKLSPPKENLKEKNRIEKPISGTAATELACPLPSISVSPIDNTKLDALKQTFNKGFRVRLKRLNKIDHNNTESWTTISIRKPIEPACSNDNFTKCDNEPEKPLPMNKLCVKHTDKNASKELQDKNTEKAIGVTVAAEIVPIKKPKLNEKLISIEETQTPNQHKTKSLKEMRYNTGYNNKQKSKSQGVAMIAGASTYLKNVRSSRKLPDNTLRAADTIQLFAITHNDIPPPAEINKKRSIIKSKCLAEDEIPRTPPIPTLLGTPPCKKTCTEKSRSQITTSKCKDQLVSSLTTTPYISSITSDITTARIYTSSPLDQTLPEYDDSVDTVADSELILPTTTGSLRRKLRRPKKSLAKPEPATDDISNQPECNGEDDNDAVADNEDDVFAEDLLPIQADSEHILEEIVSAPPSHMGTRAVIRDDYMNIEATVPVYLFNDESRDLGSPELTQSTDPTNVVDSSSYLNNTSAAATNNVAAANSASTTAALGNLEKSMLSPSEHEVSSTQETFYQTPTKNKQTELFAEKSSTSKEKSNSSSTFTISNISKQKPEDNNFKSKENYQTSNIGILQNNQVDTTNHSPEMCTLALTATTTTATNLTIRKASTHDEILFNELQQKQMPSKKRKSNTTIFCVESTSDNNTNIINKTKVVSNNQGDDKLKESLAKVDDLCKKLSKEIFKGDNNKNNNELSAGMSTTAINNGGEGGSSPSTTTTINEVKLSKTKRKKTKSSKSSKPEGQSERSSKIVLKASSLTPYISAHPLKITIPTSKLLRPPINLAPPTQNEYQQSEYVDIPNAKLFIEKEAPADKNNPNQQHNHIAQSHPITKNELTNVSAVAASKSNISQSLSTEFVNMKPVGTVKSAEQDITCNINNKTVANEKLSSSSELTTKKKEKPKSTNNTSTSITTCTNNNSDNFIFVRDKYDLIKSKDKHHHHHGHDQQSNKEKSKDKKSQIESKSAISNNSRILKSSSKEKIKGEKVKEKHKAIEKSANHIQPELLSNTKSLNSSLSVSPTSLSLTTNNTKQSTSKSSKNNSSAPSSAILKSKTNLPSTQSSIATATDSSQIATAALLTNNVRKKFKIK